MSRQDFTCAPSYRILQKMAQHPYNLAAAGALEAEGRLERYICRTPLLDLHFATQCVDDAVLDALQRLADELELVEQFYDMRRGAVVNRVEGFASENRQALHTACRDIFTDTPCAPAASSQAKKNLQDLEEFLQQVDSGQLIGSSGKAFSSIIHIGIGGSDLGPRALYEALYAYGLPGRKVAFIANIDPDDASRRLAEVELASALVVIVSKSGTTLETLTNEELVRVALERAGLDPRKHLVAVTGEGSPMDDSSRYLRSFHMYDYIGGRYSVTSMVGAVSLGFFFGLERFKQLLTGANAIDILAEETDLRRNPALLLALLGVWNHNFLGYSTLAVLPYSQPLHRFPAHLQQCDMESNGKSITRDGRQVQGKTGSVIWGEPGTNGQHAFYQLLHQGTEIVPVEFIGFKESQYGRDRQVKKTTSQQKLLANLLAQSMAFAVGQQSANRNRHCAGNRPSTIIMGQRLDAKTMGALLALYEAKIVFQGFCWGVNSFDQEGVQLGKTLATSFLQQMAGEKGRDDSLEKRFLQQFRFGEHKSF